MVAEIETFFPKNLAERRERLQANHAVKNLLGSSIIKKSLIFLRYHIVTQ